MDINLTPSLVLLLFCVCITSCPAGVNAGSACTLCSGKDEGDAHTVVLSYLSELHSLEEIKILRLQLSSRFHNQQSHASHNPVQPKPNNNPPGSNSKNRCSLGHWCCPTNPHQSDQAEAKESGVLTSPLKEMEIIVKNYKKPKAKLSTNDYNYQVKTCHFPKKDVTLQCWTRCDLCIDVEHQHLPGTLGPTW